MDKQALRERIWDDLEASGVARFPFPPHDRIPNFAGADDAADRLADTDAWAAADTVKSNPDAPQLPVRRRALRDGKTVFVAVPRLADEHPFRALEPERIERDPDATIDDATTISGIDEHGRAVGPDELPEIDLIVSGSVAVTEDGVRIGKGEGYSDLEFAVLCELGRVDDGTTTATTVHERQVVADAPDPRDHDVPMDLVVTPERTASTAPAEGVREKPGGIDWDELPAERIDEIPVLDRLRPD